MRKDPGGPRHILVIDDSEVLLSRIKKALVDDGHLVTTTTQTVGNARHLATCDLVIIDYHMPGINGLAVQQAMRAAAAHLDHEPLFYLYTSDRNVAATYAELGFDGAFPKGDESVLVQQVRAVFRLSQIRALAQKERPSATSEQVLASHRVSGTMSERPPVGPMSDRAPTSLPSSGTMSERPSLFPPSGTMSERAPASLPAKPREKK